MAKKSRRARRQQVATARPVRLSKPVQGQGQAAAKEVDFAKEYRYVLEDLKRIAIIAVALLVLLVVLAILVG
jgi:hypothetical protein